MCLFVRALTINIVATTVHAHIPLLCSAAESLKGTYNTMIVCLKDMCIYSDSGYSSETDICRAKTGLPLQGTWPPGWKCIFHSFIEQTVCLM